MISGVAVECILLNSDVFVSVHAHWLKGGVAVGVVYNNKVHKF